MSFHLGGSCHTVKTKALNEEAHDSREISGIVQQVTRLILAVPFRAPPRIYLPSLFYDADELCRNVSESLARGIRGCVLHGYGSPIVSSFTHFPDERNLA